MILLFFWATFDDIFSYCCIDSGDTFDFFYSYDMLVLRTGYRSSSCIEFIM